VERERDPQRDLGEQPREGDRKRREGGSGTIPGALLGAPTAWGGDCWAQIVIRDRGWDFVVLRFSQSLPSLILSIFLSSLVPFSLSLSLFRSLTEDSLAAGQEGIPKRRFE
jgi:hypothetical protein